MNKIQYKIIRLVFHKFDLPDWPLHVVRRYKIDIHIYIYILLMQTTRFNFIFNIMI